MFCNSWQYEDGSYGDKVGLMGKKGLAAVHGDVYFIGEGVGVACLQTLEF